MSKSQKATHNGIAHLITPRIISFISVNSVIPENSL